MSYRGPRTLPPEIVQKVEDLFREAGLTAPYLLYRTCQDQFKEGPHNLLPSQRQPERRKGWTVYLQFHGSPISLDNLKGVIAFPDVYESRLPKLKEVRLGIKEKADIFSPEMPRDVLFRSLEDLQEHLFLLPPGGSKAQ